MSLQRCEGGTLGFPIKIQQNLFSPWAGNDPSDYSSVQKLIVPNDFSISWAPTTSINVSAVNDATKFQISGLDPLSGNTTLQYGSATYKCSPFLSLVKIQHPTMSYDRSATQEVILAFQIQNKNLNPSSPDIILICRPIVLTASNKNQSGFWSSVNTSSKNNGSAVNVQDFNLSNLFAYDQDTLMPMVTYETCITTRLIGKDVQAAEGSLSIRVHVVPQALYIPSDSDGTEKCSNVSKYALITSGNGVLDVFSSVRDSRHTNVQFSTGKTDDGKSNNYPFGNTPSDYLIPSVPTNSIGQWEEVLHTFEFQVPEVFLGKSLDEIAKAKSLPKEATKKKAFKCYTIDPRKDIVGDQILVDPTTGESLADTMRQRNLDSAGGDPQLAAAMAGEAVGQTGILPGDIEQVVLIIIAVIGSLGLLAYAFYVIRVFTNKSETSMEDGLKHLAGFFAILGVLIIVETYLSADSDKKIKAAIAAAANDPKKLCYRNGVKVGKTDTRQIYTKDECTKLGGTSVEFPNNGFLVCQRPGKVLNFDKMQSYTYTELQSIAFTYFCVDK